MAPSFASQLKALLWRNYLMKVRNYRTTLQEVVTPILLIVVLAVLRLALVNERKDAIPSFPAHDLFQDNFTVPKNSSIVAGPNTPNVTAILDSVVKQLGITADPPYLLFDDINSKEMDELYTKNMSGIYAGIQFSAGNLLNYTLRLPHDTLPHSGDTEDPGDECRRIDGLDRKCKANMYLFSGFTSLQITVDSAVIKSYIPQYKRPSISVELLPKDEYIPGTSSLQLISALYFVVAFAPLVHYLTLTIVSEKESKIKVAMKIMGMKDSVFWLSWFIAYSGLVIIISVVAVIVVVAANYFKNSSLFIFFLMVILYGISIITFGFATSTFFSKSKVAGAVTSFATMFFSLLYLAVSLTREIGPDRLPRSKIPAGGQWALCLLSPVAFALGVDQGIYLDVIGIGMKFDTLKIGQFPIYGSLVMLSVDSMLYALLAAYLENVVPQDYGVQKHPLFFLQMSYWFPAKYQELDGKRSTLLEEDSNPDIELVPSAVEDKDGVRIRNIKKWFRSKKGIVVAVDGISLDIFEGQITCLLGHNGAGKTTLIHMLTGVTSPASGAAYVYGLNAANANELVHLQQIIGFCPQYNVLFEDLTVEEHFRIFAYLKGIPPKIFQREVKTCLKDVGLEKKAKTYSKFLSGGQKRKLSVGIALIGNPKVLFLDEPSSGMDPFSRRHLWSLLQSRKQDKVIVLTTHYMDEADILSDRKAILSKGKLRCVGTSLFLKSRFGMGYHLNMVTEDNADPPKILEVVKNFVPSASQSRAYGNEVSITLPREEMNGFSGLFYQLESENGQFAPNLGIRSYGIAMTTLEEVFLKLGEAESTGFGINSPLLPKDSPNESTVQQPVPESPDHPRATFIEEVSLGELLTNMTRITNPTSLFFQRLKALCKIRVLMAMRNIFAVYLRIFTPIVLVIMALALAKIMQNLLKPDDTDLKPVSVWPYLLNERIYYRNSTDSGIEDFLVALKNALFGADVLPFGPNVTWKDLAPLQTAFDVLALFGNIQSTDNTSSFNIFYNGSREKSLPGAALLIDKVMLRLLTGRLPTTIVTSSFPWPALQGNLELDVASYVSVMMIGFALASTPSAYAVECVRDRKNKARSQLRVAGVSQSLYWGSVFLVDYIQYLVPTVIMIIACVALRITQFTLAGAIIAMVLLMLLYMPVNMSVAYLFSFGFDKPETCIIVLPNVLPMLSFLPFLAINFLDTGGTQDLAKTLHYVFCVIFPPYTVFGGLHYMSKVYRFARLDQPTGDLDIPVGKYFEFDSNIPICFIVLAIDLVLLSYLIRILDIRAYGGDPIDICRKNAVMDISKTDLEPDVMDEDTDVAQERRRVDDLSRQQNDCVIMVHSIRKEFSKHEGICECLQRNKSSRMNVAVKNSTFSVMPGEVFGLLGPNGAGKTTTINMIIAEEKPTHGQVIVGKIKMTPGTLDAFQQMGYCPQHDPVWDNITLNEHVDVYAAIKGLDRQDTVQLKNRIFKSLQIDEHRSKKASELSGGTKRKLSFVMSMLGSPSVVLLDEPSTGMDPQSKRFFWDTISSAFNGEKRGAILTTHSMEEADALCSRITIMINGEMRCLGSSQHLKDKYGQGYTLEIKLRQSGDEPLEMRMRILKRLLTDLFQDIIVSEQFAERAVFKIPTETENFSLGKAFETLESLKQRLDMEEYSFSQATLEQVFLGFARQQKETEDADAENPDAEIRVGQDSNAFISMDEEPLNVNLGSSCTHL